MNPNMKKYIVAVIIVLAGVSAFTFLRKDESSDNKESSSTTGSLVKPQEEDAVNSDDVPMNFVAVPQTSEHHVSNTPEHAAILKTAPEKVSISFDIALNDISTISLTNRNTGVDVSVGGVTFSDDKKTIEKTLSDSLGNGQYSVLYSACSTSGACEMGSFQFGIKK